VVAELLLCDNNFFKRLERINLKQQNKNDWYCHVMPPRWATIWGWGCWVGRRLDTCLLSSPFPAAMFL